MEDSSEDEDDSDIASDALREAGYDSEGVEDEPELEQKRPQSHASAGYDSEGVDDESELEQKRLQSQASKDSAVPFSQDLAP
jgi:hypothetical protein